MNSLLRIIGEHINPVEHAKIETLGSKGFITHTKAPIPGVKQIVLTNSQDLAQALKQQYPFCITGIDNKTIYFYG